MHRLLNFPELGYPQISATSFIWLKVGKLDPFLSCFTDNLKGSIKDRNGMDLTEAEDIKKRCPGLLEEMDFQPLGIVRVLWHQAHWL